MKLFGYWPLLIEQGVAYKKIMDNEEITGLSVEELEIVMGVADFTNLKSTILGAMTAGMAREVEVEIDSKTKKPHRTNKFCVV